MKFDTLENQRIEEVVQENEGDAKQLSDLQLALVGGGTGEVVF